ncbi:MAG: endonuclease/exonuclease/phosphatase family protein [Verrucomicrobiaceae bacterium]|jgi:endonuclease/exonuclease/phosphatase family metal-dependent hydrolase|nr:endonuclease/exonuclease/phosphatase family protein [Verrucomicrobiaceae bacterium]
MPKAFSVLSWNVEHFGATEKNQSAPLKDPAPIVNLIRDQKADIVAIYEVRSDVVFRPLVESMPEHHFFITEGEQMQEILVGVRRTIPCFLTQKTEFKSGQSTLRPGMLVTPYIDGKFYPLLFLHVKSMTDPVGFGLRHDMTQRALDFRKVLKDAGGGQDEANYIFLGDLNTMGMDYLGNDKDIDGAREIDELRKAAGRRKMALLEKTAPATYWSAQYGMSNLDHVVAAQHLSFRQFGGKPVRVSGWTDLATDAQRAAWVAKYSDHAMLYFEVQKV